MIEAPWTDEQVANLNRWQNAGHVHEYTCPNDGLALIATNNGWRCPNCPYTQTWAYDATMAGPPPNPFETPPCS